MVYAGFWRRTAAFVVDFIIVTIINSVIHYIAFGSAATYITQENYAYNNGHFIHTGTSHGYGYGIYDWIGVVVLWIYCTWLEASSCQQTLGKRMLGIWVTDEEGKRISVLRANGRFWCKGLSALLLFIGFIMAAFTGKKQALHDILAKTLVIGAL